MQKCKVFQPHLTALLIPDDGQRRILLYLCQVDFNVINKIEFCLRKTFFIINRFGKIKKVKLMRNLKSGRSRRYAFIQVRLLFDELLVFSANIYCKLH